jgi:hypothetical protein
MCMQPLQLAAFLRVNSFHVRSVCDPTKRHFPRDTPEGDLLLFQVCDLRKIRIQEREDGADEFFC